MDHRNFWSRSLDNFVDLTDDFRFENIGDQQTPVDGSNGPLHSHSRALMGEASTKSAWDSSARDDESAEGDGEYDSEDGESNEGANEDNDDPNLPVQGDSPTSTISSSTFEKSPKNGIRPEEGGGGGIHGPATAMSHVPRNIASMRRGNLAVVLPETTLVRPKSAYMSITPAQDSTERPSKEWQAVQDMLGGARAKDKDPGLPRDDEFAEIELDDFSIYIDSERAKQELRSLQHLNNKVGHSVYHLDGRLRYGSKTHLVRRVPFDELSIGNYGVEQDTVGDQVWVRTWYNAKDPRNVYYKLCRPAIEYGRFHRDFLWTADLTKHFVDFEQGLGDRGESLSLHHFRSEFSAWLLDHHASSPAFQHWYGAFGKSDFRTAVVANMDFLYKESVGVLGHAVTVSHRIWDEIMFLSAYHPDSPKRTGEIKPTIVTPYIHNCFSVLPCGTMLEATAPSLLVNEARVGVSKTLGLDLSGIPSGGTNQSRIPLPVQPTSAKALSALVENLKPGSTISTHRDTAGTSWQKETAVGFTDTDRWFGLVQSVHKRRHGGLSFDIIWYYRPVDTLCGRMKYPHHNELFLSDHCTCSSGGESSRIHDDEIIGVHRVEFGGSSNTAAEFFCRQTYRSAERSWITFKPEHKLCPCRRGDNEYDELCSRFVPGSTVLAILSRGSRRLEPCEIVEFIDESQKVVVRRLLRRLEIDPPAPPNELVYSEIEMSISYRDVDCECFVRFFTVGATIPAPYNSNGVGHVFYITHQASRDTDGRLHCFPLDTFPSSLRQGHDPEAPRKKLRGLDLFCGGGNFGRGLEEGGAVEMRWANDIDCRAIHTYMANAAPGVVKPFLGSIDDLQQRAMAGSTADNVPDVGMVDFISGGSPCPGFSRLTNDRTTQAQRKNQSLVAAFASMVDLYRPRYALLENVIGIVQASGDRSEDVFSQLICALVGLGYQAQFYLLDAWSYGGPQWRSRVFLYVAAPNRPLPSQPRPSHSHPPFVRSLGLGSLSNGEKVGEREFFKAYPFEWVSARASTANLPDIADAQPNSCVQFPDHRVPSTITNPLRYQFRCVPIYPPGMNFTKTWNEGKGVMSRGDRELFPEEGSMRVQKHSNGWGRVIGNGLMPTITTTLGATDFKTGRQLHWEQARTLTVMEARRAQGFRDDEVILGHPRDQWKTVGNSVPRELALTLGIQLRAAIDSAHKSEPGAPPHHLHSSVSVVSKISQDMVISDSGKPCTITETREEAVYSEVSYEVPMNEMPTPWYLSSDVPPSKISVDIRTTGTGHKRRISQTFSSQVTYQKRVHVDGPNGDVSFENQETTQ